MSDKAFIFFMLPLYFANARSNDGVGIYGAIIMLLKLLLLLDETACMDQTDLMTLTVDLNDVAIIVSSVRGTKAMEACLDYAKILQKANKISVVMTGKSWQAASDMRKSDPKQE